MIDPVDVTLNRRCFGREDTPCGDGDLKPNPDSPRKRRIGAVLGALFMPRPSFGLAAGIVLGIATVAMGGDPSTGQDRIDPSSLVDTMMSSANLNQSRRIYSDSFSNDQFSGRLTADTVGDVVTLRLELESPDDVSMIISFEGASCVLQAFSQTNPTQNTMKATNCALYLTHRGKNEYVFALKRIYSDGAWPFVYLQGNGAAYRKRITPPALGNGC